MLWVGDAGRCVVLERRRVFTAERRHDTGEDDRQPVAARVHDARLAQRRKQLGPSFDGVLPCVDGALEGGGDRSVLLARLRAGVQARVVLAVGDIRGDPVGHLASHRQDRPLGGLPHG